MKPVVALVCLVSLAAGAAVAVAPAQDMQPARPSAEHEWLGQLVGRWSARSEASMDPDAEPMVMESTESVRSLGGLWIVAEGQWTLSGNPFTSLLTLGYDPHEKVFVGTWVDSMQSVLWTYRGTLDAAQKTLTLDTEGPSWDDPAVKARYRDAIEIVDRDRRVLTSSVQEPDGSWTTFQRAEYRREE